MKGLLRKDLYSLVKLGKLYLIIIVGFWGAYIVGYRSEFYFSYPTIMLSMLGISLISYDERSRWDKYCDSLPVTRAQTVTSKYLLLGILVAVMSLFSVIVAIVSTHELLLSLYLAAVSLGVSLFLPAVSMPLCYKFGTEQARWVTLVALGGSIALFFILGSLLFDNLFDPHSYTTRIPMTALLLLPLFGLVCYFLSWRLSIKIYQNREL